MDDEEKERKPLQEPSLEKSSKGNRGGQSEVSHTVTQ